MLTRVDPAYHYPGKSVVEDLRLMIKRETGATSYGLRYWELQGSRLHAGGFIVSLPIDLALDTVLLPYDVGVGLYLLWFDGDDDAVPAGQATASDRAPPGK